MHTNLSIRNNFGSTLNSRSKIDKYEYSTINDFTKIIALSHVGGHKIIQVLIFYRYNYIMYNKRFDYKDYQKQLKIIFNTYFKQDEQKTTRDISLILQIADPVMMFRCTFPRILKNLLIGIDNNGEPLDRNIKRIIDNAILEMSECANIKEFLSEIYVEKKINSINKSLNDYKLDSKRDSMEIADSDPIIKSFTENLSELRQCLKKKQVSSGLIKLEHEENDNLSVACEASEAGSNYSLREPNEIIDKLFHDAKQLQKLQFDAFEKRVITIKKLTPEAQKAEINRFYNELKNGKDFVQGGPSTKNVSEVSLETFEENIKHFEHFTVKDNQYIPVDSEGKIIGSVRSTQSYTNNKYWIEAPAVIGHAKDTTKNILIEYINNNPDRFKEMSRLAALDDEFKINEFQHAVLSELLENVTSRNNIKIAEDFTHDMAMLITVAIFKKEAAKGALIDEAVKMVLSQS